MDQGRLKVRASIPRDWLPLTLLFLSRCAEDEGTAILPLQKCGENGIACSSALSVLTEKT